MKGKVLIVDDSAVVRKVFRKTVEIAQLELDTVLEAGDGAAAWEIVQREPVDVIFLDINMPVMDGIGFLKLLRSESQFDEISVIIMSTEANRERIQAFKEWNITTYLRKPVRPERVADALREALLKE